MLQGFIYAFALKEPGNAASFYELAASKTKSPPWVASLAKKMAARENLSIEEVKQNLEALFNNAEQINLKEFISRKHHIDF
ncbi:MAG: hypothetical protein HQK54_04325, partial [Oligoflexales bacterium]|nr:hypothetical protein [Oligoflexales bacterium]